MWKGRILGGAGRTARALVGAVMLLAVGLNCVNVLGRYLFNAPIHWAEDVIVFGLVWSIFLGAVLVTKDGAHIKIDAADGILTQRWRRIRDWTIALFMMGILAFVTYHSIDVVALVATTGQKTSMTELPLAILHLSLPTGFLLMILVAPVAAFRGSARESYSAGETAADQEGS